MTPGYFAPAEDAPHARTWMGWPARPSIYGGAGGYYESVQETLGRLAAAIAENEAVTMLAGAEHHGRGRSFELADIPSAEDVRSPRADFFSGYANYYAGNGALHTPRFSDRRTDDHAVSTLARLYPGRRIVALELDRIYENGGGIHCVTQQEPAV